jgi:hypothetical protein
VWLRFLSFRSCAGFGPGTANMFRKMLGLPEAVYEEKKQATLSDF